jgi:hypothetical protein
LGGDSTVEALVSGQDGLLVDLIFTIVFHFAPFLSGRLSTVCVTAASFVASIYSEVTDARAESGGSFDGNGLSGTH